MTAQLISVVLPVHNQADHLRKIIEEYEVALACLQCPHELILVPNGCRDQSLAISQALAAHYPAVRVVTSEQSGWGAAVRCGLQEACGDLLCYTNAARTTARDLTHLLRCAETSPHAVIKADRTRRDNWRRGLGSQIYNRECRALFGPICQDINGTPKVFPRAFDRLLHLTRDDDLLDVEFAAICHRAGYSVIGVPVFATRRHGGKSTTSYRSALRMYLGAYRLWRTMREGRT